MKEPLNYFADRVRLLDLREVELPVPLSFENKVLLYKTCVVIYLM